MIDHAPSPSSRRRLGALAVAGLAALLGLTACGAAAPGEAGSADTRTFVTDLGEVQVPTQIERVVSVDFYTPAALMDLGVTPVGVVNTYFTDTEGQAIPTAYSAQIAAADTESIGEYYELNVEAIAQAKPDVILATNDFLPLDDALRPQLEKIAPIVTFSARDSLSWKTRADGVAELLGLEAKLAPVKAEYEQRLDEVGDAHRSFLDERSIAIFVASQEATWGTYAATHFTGGVWSDLGARYREQTPDEINENDFPNWFSYEELGRLRNADVLFFQNEELPAEVTGGNAIWEQLPAVKNGLVFPNILRSPTGSYGWALENINDIDVLLTEVDDRIAAR